MSKVREKLKAWEALSGTKPAAVPTARTPPTSSPLGSPRTPQTPVGAPIFDNTQAANAVRAKRNNKAQKVNPYLIKLQQHQKSEYSFTNDNPEEELRPNDSDSESEEELYDPKTPRKPKKIAQDDEVPISQLPAKRPKAVTLEEKLSEQQFAELQQQMNQLYLDSSPADTTPEAGTRESWRTILTTLEPSPSPGQQQKKQLLQAEKRKKRLEETADVLSMTKLTSQLAPAVENLPEVETRMIRYRQESVVKTISNMMYQHSDAVESDDVITVDSTSSEYEKEKLSTQLVDVNTLFKITTTFNDEMFACLDDEEQEEILDAEEEQTTNPLFEEYSPFINPLFEKEHYFKNTLYDPDIVYYNPLFEEGGNALLESQNAEADEQKLVWIMKNSSLLKERTIRLQGFKAKTLRRCYTGAELVDWITQNAGQHFIRSDASVFAQQLMDRFVFKNVLDLGDRTFHDSHEHYYQFTEHWEDKTVMNNSIQQDNPYEPPLQLANVMLHMSRLIKDISMRYADIISSIYVFDYLGFAESPQFTEMLSIAHRLQKLDPLRMRDDKERICFFINVYNIMMLHALIKCGSPTNAILRQKFFKSNFYVIGNYKMSLFDIELYILRKSNYTHESISTFGGASASSIILFNLIYGDPASAKQLRYNQMIQELRVQQEDVNPAVHFALFKGTLSSPPLRAFEYNSLEAQLQEHAISFVSKTTKLELSEEKSTISLSKIFHWYVSDFVGPMPAGIDLTLPMVSTIKHFLSKEQQSVVETMQKNLITKPISIKYEYDWALNSLQLVQQAESNKQAAAQSTDAVAPQQTETTDKITTAAAVASQNRDKTSAVELEEVTSNPTYRFYFLKFSKSEHSEENLFFCLQVEQFKVIDDLKERLEAAQAIFHKFLEPGKAEMELNITGNLVKEIQQKIAVCAISLEQPQRSTPTEFSMPESPISALSSLSEDGSLHSAGIFNKSASFTFGSSSSPMVEVLPNDLFIKVEKYVRQNMLDTFMRFKTSELYAEMIEEAMQTTTTMNHEVDPTSTSERTDLTEDTDESSDESDKDSDMEDFMASLKTSNRAASSSALKKPQRGSEDKKKRSSNNKKVSLKASPKPSKHVRVPSYSERTAARLQKNFQ